MLNRPLEQVVGGRRGSLTSRRGSIQFDPSTLATASHRAPIEPSPFTSTARRGSLLLAPVVGALAGTPASSASSVTSLKTSTSAPAVVEGHINGGTGSRRGSLLALPLRRGSVTSQKGGSEGEYQGQRRGTRMFNVCVRSMKCLYLLTHNNL